MTRHRTCPFALVTAGLVVTAAVLLNAQPVDTLYAGHAHLHGRELPLGTQVFHSFKIEDATKTPLNTTVQTISRADYDGIAVYKIESKHFSASDTTVGRIVIRQDDFSLVHHVVRARHDSTSVSYAAGFLTGWVVLPGKPTRLLQKELQRRVFPVDGPAPWFVSLLPLQESYKAVVPRFSQWEGKEKLSIIEVVGTEQLDWNGRKLECWLVDGGELGPPGYRAFLWIDKTTQRVLQTALRGRPGQVEYSSIVE